NTLRITGSGMVNLMGANQVPNLTTYFTGPVTFQTMTSLSLATVTNQGLTTAGVTAGGNVILNVGGNYTDNFGYNVGASFFFVIAGIQGTPATVIVNALGAAGLAQFRGTNIGDPNLGDKFSITPSPFAPIIVEALAPASLPGDSLQVNLSGT